jgi:hypothetical protein
MQALQSAFRFGAVAIVFFVTSRIWFSGPT